MANVKTDTFSGGYGNTQHNARMLNLSALEIHTIYGSRPRIDTKSHLAYTQSYQKQNIDLFISQIALSLDPEGFNNEMLKMSV